MLADSNSRMPSAARPALPDGESRRWWLAYVELDAMRVRALNRSWRAVFDPGVLVSAAITLRHVPPGIRPLSAAGRGADGVSAPRVGTAPRAPENEIHLVDSGFASSSARTVYESETIYDADPPDDSGSTPWRDEVRHLERCAGRSTRQTGQPATKVLSGPRLVAG